MKASVWNILSVAFLIGTVFLVVIFGIIFLMPNQVLPASLRPVQVPDKLLLPTPTETAFQFPPTWTKSPLPVTPSNTLEPTATTKPSETVQPTETVNPNVTVDPNATASPSVSPSVSVSAGYTLPSKSPTGTRTTTITATYTSTVKIVVVGNKSPTFTKTKKATHTKTPTAAPTDIPGFVAFGAVDDSILMPAGDTSVTFNVLANDHNVTGTPLRIVKIYKGPSNGTVEVLRDNATIIYYPKPGATTDYFQYKMTNTGGLTDFGDVYITIGPPVGAKPSAIALSPDHWAENQPGGLFIGQLSTTDIDSTSFTYTLVSGFGDTGNSSFTLTEDGKLYAATSFDREEKSVYSIRVRSMDPTLLYIDQVVSIYIDNVNEAPYFSSSENGYIKVGTAGTITVRAVDNDTGDSVTFSLSPSSVVPTGVTFASGASNTATFTMDTTTAVGDYPITIIATDSGGLTATQSFTLHITVD